MIADPEDPATCATCERPVAEVNRGADWTHLEVTRGDPPADVQYVDADFCSQAHAAEWLSGPLPMPSPPEAVEVGRRERLFAWVLVVCALSAIALMLLGAYALVRLLGGWS
ncbi:MAG: hypothetical protein AVDCRST_MAG57-2296 [uncultured Blastococcus sp.]|uniref:Uncharacterized protein n=1 Tax=uncultured Blastococcus sp. TaxID=217144 RepID=A0A6J4IM31_9ACTN|nr:MAG: hypothetical protein AVDCRST_MAG57-2296 [uncultured Blastococcus sp.]